MIKLSRKTLPMTLNYFFEFNNQQENHDVIIRGLGHYAFFGVGQKRDNRTGEQSINSYLFRTEFFF